MSEQLLSITTTSKYEIKNGIGKMYDLVGEGNFSNARNQWLLLKRDVIKFYGIKGREYKDFKNHFRHCDYILTRTPIDANKERVFEILMEMSRLIKTGGMKHDGTKDALLAQVKEIYTDLIESYRLLMTKVHNTEKERGRTVGLSNIIGDGLMELRDLEPPFRKLGDHNVYKKYNTVRMKIGSAESILPRIVDSFRSSQVKQKFQAEFGELFKAIEDLLAPVQEKNLKDYEEIITKLFGQGKTFAEIAEEIGVDVNVLTTYIEENMKPEDFKEGEKEDENKN